LRFLVDECTGPAVAPWLSTQGHNLLSIFHTDRGAPDTAVLARALAEDRILVTNDKGFGEMIFRKGRQHRGVVLLRLVDERPAVKIQVLERLPRHRPASA
jgi:predicted nuclease of predicted toxin-antitoxin system